MLINNLKLRQRPLRLAVLAALLCWLSCGQLRAWDSTPDTNGFYDGVYSRPTHFPEWSQPNDWANGMFYRCEVRMGDVNGPKLSNYEIAVYNKEDNTLRSCCRSITSQDDICVLTIKGTEGQSFYFQVIYGDDFTSPTVIEAEIPNDADNAVPFNTNQEVGLQTPFVLVVPGRTYLSETSETAIESKTGVDVTVLRTINANEWGTICLPFAIPANQMSTAFGTDVTVELRDFIGCEVEFEDDEKTDVKNIKVNTEPAEEIEANHPYLIKVNKAVTEINVDGVDIAPEEEPSVDCDRIGKGTKKDPYRWNSFIGNYENDFYVPEECLFLSGGKFWYSTGKTKMKPFRAYFDFYDVLPEGASSQSSARITFDFGETEVTPEPETPTGVVTTNYTNYTDFTDGVFYDLSGRKVSKAVKGVYIKNGRKIIIK